MSSQSPAKNGDNDSPTNALAILEAGRQSTIYTSPQKQLSSTGSLPPNNNNSQTNNSSNTDVRRSSLATTATTYKNAQGIITQPREMPLTSGKVVHSPSGMLSFILQEDDEKRQKLKQPLKGYEGTEEARDDNNHPQHWWDGMEKKIEGAIGFLKWKGKSKGSISSSSSISTCTSKSSRSSSSSNATDWPRNSYDSSTGLLVHPHHHAYHRYHQDHQRFLGDLLPTSFGDHQSRSSSLPPSPSSTLPPSLTVSSPAEESSIASTEMREQETNTTRLPSLSILSKSPFTTGSQSNTTTTTTDNTASYISATNTTIFTSSSSPPPSSPPPSSTISRTRTLRRMRTFYDLNSQLSGGPTGTRPRHPQALENDGRGTEWTLSDEEEWLLDEAAAAAMTAGAEHTVPNQQYGDGEADEYDDEGKVPLDYADLSDNEGKVPTEYVDLSTVDRPRGRGRAVSYLPVGHDSSGRITTTAATHNNDSNSNSHSSHSQESVPSRPRTALESLQEFCRRSNVGRPTGVAATTTTTTTMTTPFSREAEENRADMENGTPDRSVLPANWRRTPSPAPSEGSGNLQGSLVASTLTYRHSSDTESQDSFVSFPSPEYFEDSEDHNPSPSSSSP